MSHHRFCGYSFIEQSSRIKRQGASILLIPLPTIVHPSSQPSVLVDPLSMKSYSDPALPSIQDLALKTHAELPMDSWSNEQLREWLEVVLRAATGSPSSHTSSSDRIKHVIEAIFEVMKSSSTDQGSKEASLTNPTSLKRKRDQSQDLSSASMLFGTTTAAGRLKLAHQQQHRRNGQDLKSTATASSHGLITAFKLLNMKQVIDRLRVIASGEEDVELVAMVDVVRTARNQRLTHEQQQLLLQNNGSAVNNEIRSTSSISLDQDPRNSSSSMRMEEDETLVGGSSAEEDLQELLGEVLHTKSQFSIVPSSLPPATSMVASTNNQASATEHHHDPASTSTMKKAIPAIAEVTKPKIIVKIV